MISPLRSRLAGVLQSWLNCCFLVNIRMLFFDSKPTLNSSQQGRLPERRLGIRCYLHPTLTKRVIRHLHLGPSTVHGELLAANK